MRNGVYSPVSNFKLQKIIAEQVMNVDESEKARVKVSPSDTHDSGEPMMELTECKSIIHLN